MRLLEPIFIALALTVTGADTVWACSCLPPPAPNAALDYATAVFAGRIYRVDDARKGAAIQSSMDPMVYYFRVEYLWRGPATDTIVVHTVRADASCGYHFKADQLYIVYAEERSGKLKVGLCSRTNPFEYALWDRYSLPPPTPMPGAPAYVPFTREYIVDQIGSSDRRMFYQAAEALGGSEDDRNILLRELRSIIRGERPGDTAMAIDMLTRFMGDSAQSAVHEICSIATNGDVPARAQALRTLRTMLSYESYYPYLIAALTDTSASVKMEALAQFSYLGRADTLSSEELAALDRPPYMIELFNGRDSEHLFKLVSGLLTDDNKYLRGDAIQCLQHFRTRRNIVIPLMEAIGLTDPFMPNRRSANRILEHLKIQSPDSL
jgi:hypothetical protein